ncbi:MAG: hypothetical protein EOP61_30015, partial [Sphingomonadales bacterium]
MTAHRTLGRYGLALGLLLSAQAASATETVVALSPEAREQVLNEAAARNAGRVEEPVSNGVRRGVHGEVAMMIGTNGARGIRTAMDAPIGDTGWVSV